MRLVYLTNHGSFSALSAIVSLIIIVGALYGAFRLFFDVGRQLFTWRTPPPRPDRAGPDAGSPPEPERGPPPA